MTRAQRLLVLASVLIGAWALLGVVLRDVLEMGDATQAPMSLLERVAISCYSFGLRYLPWILTPVILAPVAVVWLWLVPRTRPSQLETPAQERRHLGQWLAWLCVAVSVSVLSLAAWQQVPLGVKLWGLMAFAWSYAGSLHRALRLQSLRHRAGYSRVSPFALAVTAGATLPLQPIGVSLPVWAFWSSRRAHEEDNAPPEARRPTNGCS